MVVNLPVDGFKFICLSLILHVGLHTLASAVLDLLVSFSHIVLSAICTRIQINLENAVSIYVPMLLNEDESQIDLFQEASLISHGLS